MSGRRVAMSASPFGPRAAVRPGGTPDARLRGHHVASASCSTCCSLPTATLRGGSR